MSVFHTGVHCLASRSDTVLRDVLLYVMPRIFILEPQTELLDRSLCTGRSMSEVPNVVVSLCVMYATERSVSRRITAILAVPKTNLVPSSWCWFPEHGHPARRAARIASYQRSAQDVQEEKSRNEGSREMGNSCANCVRGENQSYYLAEWERWR